MTRRRELGAEEGGGRLAGAYVRSGGIWRVRRCHPRLIPVNTPLAASVSSCPPPRRPPRPWTAQTTPRHRPLPLNVRARLVPAPRSETHPVVLFVDPPPRQPSISPRPQCRTRSTSLQRRSLRPGNRTPPATHAGPYMRFRSRPGPRRTRSPTTEPARSSAISCRGRTRSVTLALDSRSLLILPAVPGNARAAVDATPATTLLTRFPR